MAFSEFEFIKFIDPNYKLYFVRIFKFSFNWIDFIKDVFYTSQYFINIKLLLCYIYNIDYILFIFKYYKYIFD